MATELATQQGMHITPETPGGPIAAAQRQDDAPEGEHTEQREKQRNPRDEMMLRIAERRNEALAREIAYGTDIGLPDGDEAQNRHETARRRAEDPNEPPGSAAEPPPARAEAPQVAQPEAQAHPQPSAQSPQMIPFDPGNGQVIWVTPEQLTQLARDGATARLALQQHQAQMQNQPTYAAPAAGPAAPPAVGNTPGQPPYDERTESLFRRLTYGDANEGAKALQEFASDVIARARSSSPDPQQIANFATQRAIDTLRMESNLHAIGSEFPDVFNDKILSQVAALRVGELRQQYAMVGRRATDLDLYRDACASVRASVRGSTPQPPASDTGPERNQPVSQAAPVATTGFQAKLERKRAAPQQPASVGRVAAADEGKPWTGDRSSVVDQMRRARGQPSMR